MTIMESAIAMNRDYLECNKTLAKIELFANTSYREYEINIKESALKVLKENGSDEDFDFLVVEAGKGYIERAKNAIKKIVEAVQKFIERLIDTLTKLVTGEKAQNALDKAEELCASNSQFRSTKIEYENTDKQVGALQQGIDAVRKKVSKIKAKGATEKDREEIEEIKNNTLKKVAAITATTAITLGAAIAICKTVSSKSEVDDQFDSASSAESCSTISEDYDNEMAALEAGILTYASGVIGSMQKEKASKKSIKFSTLWRGIKQAVTGAFTKSENIEKKAHESTFEGLEMYAQCEVIEESSEEESENSTVEEGLDLDKYFDEMCDDLFNESEDTTEEEIDEVEDDADEEPEDESDEGEVQESAEEDTRSETEIYMEQLERELFGEYETITTESSDDSEEDDTDSSIQSLLDEMESLL